MDRQIDGLLERFRIGTISRRELFRNLAFAGVSFTTASKLAAAATPASPLAEPMAHFAPKGFKTVGLSHISYTVKDHVVSRDFYAGLLGMKLTVYNGRPNESILTWARGNREYLVCRNHPQVPPAFKSNVDHLALEVADWDDAKMAAEVKSRGYGLRPDFRIEAMTTPRPKQDGSFFVRDPGGLLQQISGVGLSAVHPVYLPERTPITSQPKQDGGFKTLSLNHLSYSVPDYTVVRDWYADLMGMKIALDHGRPNEALLTWSHGDSEYMIVRNHRERPGQPFDPNAKGYIDHFGFTIEDWDTKKVEKELKRKGLDPRPHTEDSFYVKDPDGFDVLVCGPGLSARHPIYRAAPKTSGK